MQYKHCMKLFETKLWVKLKKKKICSDFSENFDFFGGIYFHATIFPGPTTILRSSIYLQRRSSCRRGDLKDGNSFFTNIVEFERHEASQSRTSRDQRIFWCDSWCDIEGEDIFTCGIYHLGE